MISSSKAAGDEPEEGEDEGEGEEVKQQRMKTWEKHESNVSQLHKDCYVSWDTLGSHILAVIATQANILVLQATAKNFPTELHPPNPFFSSMQSSPLPLQTRLWCFALDYLLGWSGSNVAATAKHWTAPETSQGTQTKSCLLGYRIRVTHLGFVPPAFSPNPQCAATPVLTQKQKQ